MWIFGRCTKCKSKVERCESVLYCKCRQKVDNRWKPSHSDNVDCSHSLMDVSGGVSEIIPQTIVSPPQKPLKALLDGKEVDVVLSPESQKELNEIHKKTLLMLKPLYDKLGVKDGEDISWFNGHVCIVNIETRQKREIVGKSQSELNDLMLNSAMELSEKEKKLGS